MILSLLPNKRVLPSRELLILDEAHLLETEIVKFTGISISKRRWKRYIPNLKLIDHGYNDIEKWINFLIDLETKMLELDIPEELVPDAMTDTEKLSRAIGDMRSNPKNWIVTEIKKENNELTKVELKPLDVSHYCKGVFKKCNKILMMSATILDSNAFCTNLGLAPEEVKFIQVPSDFPLQNRPIYPLDIAYLNSNSLQLQEVQTKVARAVDNLMTSHRNDKGIIHTTTYKQLNFIQEKISQTNRCRLFKTDPKIPRDKVITEHVNNIKPTVLISPSLYIGLDLKDDLSRFQIIIKVPYPDLGDRWINEKRKKNGQWYIWQTALRLVQGYGRTIRSKDDWAKTYVLDSAFGSFVKKNKNILPNWFIQAIQSDLNAPLGQAALDTVQVFTTSKEDHNEVTDNHHSPTNISENQISFYIPKPPDQSGTLARLDSYNNDKSNRTEQLFICPYCPKFSSALEKEYLRHIVLRHPGKSGYNNMAVAG